jgi:hypothetical protein
MGWLGNLGNALISCVSKPIEVLCDWASNHLKKEHMRDMNQSKLDHQRNMDTLTAQSSMNSKLKNLSLNTN